MSIYIVKEGNTVRKDGQDYTAGSRVELEEEEAAAMPWAVENREAEIPDEAITEEPAPEDEAAVDTGKARKGGRK